LIQSFLLSRLHLYVKKLKLSRQLMPILSRNELQSLEILFQFLNRLKSSEFLWKRWGHNLIYYLCAIWRFLSDKVYYRIRVLSYVFISLQQEIRLIDYYVFWVEFDLFVLVDLHQVHETFRCRHQNVDLGPIQIFYVRIVHLIWIFTIIWKIRIIGFEPHIYIILIIADVSLTNWTYFVYFHSSFRIQGNYFPMDLIDQFSI